MKVTFRIVKQLFPKDQFSEKTYRIFSCVSSTPNVELNKYGTFSIKGELPFLTVGEEYEYDIEIADRNQYGTTYVINDALNGFDSCNLTDKQSYDIIKSVTSSNDIADAIYSAYPNFVQLIINGEDEKIDLKNIYNVGVYRYNTYKQKIINDYKILMLQSKLDKWDLSTEDIKVLLQKYKDYNEINRAFIEHPYETYCELLQRDFYDVDKFIISDDKSHKNSLERAEFNCIDVLKRNQYDGNTRINANTMARFVERDCLPQLVEAVKNSDRIFFDDTTKYCALQSTYNMEKTVANTIKGLVENKEGLNIDVGAYKKILTGENNTKLTDEQMSVLDLVNDNRVCLLMGGAGCGKSTSTKAITDMLKSENITFRLVAPTGIAARRLSKATGYKATTVHYAYYTSEGEPFVEDVIVCDEASMLSLETMYMLCSMLTQYHRLILICDPAQLASISEGNILSDIIESGIVPSVTLSKVFRFGIGKIATVTTNIRNGIPYVDNSGMELFSAKEKDYEFHIIKENPIEQIIDIFDKCINEYNYSYKDILILSPFNKGSFGTRAINSAIQERYNPSDIYVRYKRDGKDTELHIGDKVVNCKNNREATTLEMHEENENIKQMLSDGTLPIDYQPKIFDKVFLANGDIGYVKDIDMNTKTVFVEFDLGVIVYYQDNLKNLMLAQSLSVHKCQGAEAKCIILITHPQHKRMLTRNLLYVATSRAKERLIEIGSPETINEAIKVVETEERDTYLAEMLKEIIPF